MWCEKSKHEYVIGIGKRKVGVEPPTFPGELDLFFCFVALPTSFSYLGDSQRCTSRTIDVFSKCIH